MKKICFFVLSLALFCGLTSCSNGLGMASVRIPVDFSELVASRNGDEQNGEFFAFVIVASESGDYIESRCRHFSSDSEENAKFEFDFGAIPSGIKVHVGVELIKTGEGLEYYSGESDGLQLLKAGRNSIDICVSDAHSPANGLNGSDFAISYDGKRVDAWFYVLPFRHYLIADTRNNVISLGKCTDCYSGEAGRDILTSVKVKELMYASDFSVEEYESDKSFFHVKKYGIVQNPREIEASLRDGFIPIKFTGASGVEFNADYPD